jgi:hypothetical protein
MTTTPTATTDLTGHFGVCPECHQTDGYINVGRGHWFYCERDRTRWFAGENLFSSWREQTEDEQREIYARLGFSRFQEVEPVYFRDQTPPTLCDSCGRAW